MKSRIVAIMFLLVAMVFAQSAPQASTTTTPDQQSGEKTHKVTCACCDKMAKDSGKDTEISCCYDMAAKGAKSDIAACQSKDCKSCMASKDGNAVDCCASGSGKSCSAQGDQQETAMACCSGEKCDRHAHGTKT